MTALQVIRFTGDVLVKTKRRSDEFQVKYDEHYTTTSDGASAMLQTPSGHALPTGAEQRFAFAASTGVLS